MQASARMALMEWEFTEGPDNEGQFMATGKVIETLRRHLARKEIDEAVALYETCVQETVGQELWQEFESASTPTKKAIANLFFRSRDYARAGQACEQLGEWAAAGRAYGAAHNWTKAAECVQKTGERVRAAQMYLKGGVARKAAELFYESNRLPEAAEALEMSQDLVGSGQLFMRAGDPKRAADVLSRVTMQDPRFLQAVGMLSEVLVSLNRRDLAIQRLAAVVRQGQVINDVAHAELAYRLGRLMIDEGQPAQARMAFEKVHAFDPKYRDVAARIQGLGRAHLGSHPPGPTGSIPTAPASSDPRESHRVVAGHRVPATSSDAFAALSGNPFASRSSSPADAPATASAFVQRMAGYDVLKRLPIFEDLNLDEMKTFYTICEQTLFQPGEIIIEQGHPGSGLVIVREGRLRVTRVDDGGHETQLAEIPAGQYVGEMSLVDEVPTSARVSAVDMVKALRVTKARFEQFLLSHEKIALRVYRSFLKTLSRRLREQNAQRSRAGA